VLGGIPQQHPLLSRDLSEIVRLEIEVRAVMQLGKADAEDGLFEAADLPVEGEKGLQWRE